MTPAPVIYDLPEVDYHGDKLCPEPSLSRGIAHTMLTRSPLHARHRALSAATTSSDMDFGSAAHRLFLGKGAEIEVIEAPDWRRRKAFDPGPVADEARAAGKIPILAKSFEHVSTMVTAGRRQLEAMDLPVWRNADAEVSCFWRQDGVWNRARIDLLPRDLSAICDLKTTASAHPDDFVRQAFRMGWHMQAAHYQSAVMRCFKLKRDIPFWFLVLERDPPYALSVIELDGAAIALARRSMERAREMWRRCLDTDVWPGYAQGVAVVDTPAWKINELEMADALGAAA